MTYCSYSVSVNLFSFLASEENMNSVEKISQANKILFLFECKVTHGIITFLLSLVGFLFELRMVRYTIEKQL